LTFSANAKLLQLLPTSVDLSRIPECRSSTFCFFKRFELSEAIKRLERLERASFA